MLEVRNITLFVDGLCVLDSVSINVRIGESVGLVGANGAGKSSLLRSISGLQRLHNGEITFEGQRIDLLEPHVIARLGIAHCPEGRRIFPGLTVLEQLQLAARGCGQRGRSAFQTRLDEVVHIWPVLKEKLNTEGQLLSGGEQQMLALARAIFGKPKLLLIDEPTMGLSPVAISDFYSHLERIQKEAGLGVLISEQKALRALKATQRAYLLEQGKLVAEGKSNELNSDTLKRAYL